MNNLIGISGKINSGKDLVGSIIQYLNDYDSAGYEHPITEDDFARYILNDHNHRSTYQIKKYADKLKDIVCLMIGCTRADLEDREFKEKPLGEEWDCLETTSSYGGPTKIAPMGSMEWTHTDRRRTTPRLLLQLMGTECGRQILHPNIWINALFADYTCDEDKSKRDYEHIANYRNSSYPNWIITDVRFPDEVKAIEDRGGIVIRLERPIPVHDENGEFLGHLEPGWTKDCLEGFIKKNEHESETALDNHEFTHTIQNDGSIEELIEKVKLILNQQ